MSNEREEQVLPLWEQLQLKSKNWLEAQKASGNHPPFAHPNEVAERVLIKIRGYVKEKGTDTEFKIIESAFRIAAYSDVINFGENVHIRFLLKNPEAKRQHLTDNILESLVPQTAA